ncbi:MAG: aspartate kinase, partial [Cyclobacteriaceae bacterium]|nr:aspartate kinase [Cyclobacteriaceae bacterium]
MQVFKFGGASIKEGKAVANVAEIIKKYKSEPLVVVVSAMGKTTRALEDLLAHKNDSSFESKWNKIKAYHFDIIRELFPINHPVFLEINTRFTELSQLNYKLDDSVLLHAQVVSFGEIFSSIIIANYLNYIENITHWLFAPDVIATTKLFSEGEVNWEETTHNIRKDVAPLLKDKIIITQGYIASSKEGVITLGKEGSDYTAAIFAACLNASKVTIWKDVPGILNADPKEVKDYTQFFELPYTEAS